MPSASYIFDTISNSKDIEQFSQGEIDKDYVPYVINRMVAGYRELIFLADAMNSSYSISKQHQMEFYNEMIAKKNRRVIWSNRTKNVNIEIIMDYYNVSYDKAEVYSRILNEEQVNEMKDSMEHGGRE